MGEVIDISSTDNEFDSWGDDDDLEEEINGSLCNSLKSYSGSISDVHNGHNGDNLLSTSEQIRNSDSSQWVSYDTMQHMGNGNAQTRMARPSFPPMRQAANHENSSEQPSDFGDAIGKDGTDSKKCIQRATLPLSIIQNMHSNSDLHSTINGNNSTSLQGDGESSRNSSMAFQKTMFPGGEADSPMYDNVYVEYDQQHATDTKQKRILPYYFPSGVSQLATKLSPEINDDIQVLGFHPKMAMSVEPKVATLDTPKFGIKDDMDRRIVHIPMYENDGTPRKLPPWMSGDPASRHVAYSSTASSSLHSGSTVEHFGNGEKSVEDERLIFQAALQDLSHPRHEINFPPDLLSVPLLRHQRTALSWMKRMESSLHCSGGILADDQGLGKTVSVIALIQMERSDQVQFSSGLPNFPQPDAQNLDEFGNTVLQKTISSGNHIKGKPQNGSFNHSGHTGSKFFNLVEIDDEREAKITEFDASGMEHYHAAPEMSEATHSAEHNSSKKGPGKGREKCMMHKGRPAGGTLVVCPASILQQWARELDDKVPDGRKLSVLIYHGSSRSKDPTFLAKHDVVLTTYAIVTNEVPKQPLSADDDGEDRNAEKYALCPDFPSHRKRKKTSNVHKSAMVKKKGLSDSSLSGPLGRVRWFRVVLDEAQTIKNFRTQVSRACCGLRAKRRWCLSGTPLQNSLDDLYSYIRFLKYDPYAAYTKFVSSIKNPIIRNAAVGYKKLQAILGTIMLRRTKATMINGEPVIKLPPKVINLKKIDFSPDEREFYSKLEADTRQKFKAFTVAGTVNENYASILALLLRLRQACDHPFLVKGYNPGPISSASLKIAQQLPRELLTHLLNQLDASSTLCGMCSDQPENAVVTMCGHVFCHQCIFGYLSGDVILCPGASCKDNIDANSIFSGTTLKKCISGEPAENTSEAVKQFDLSSRSSSKIEAAMDIIRSICKGQCPDAGEKSFKKSSSQDENCTTFMENHSDSDSKILETKSENVPEEIPIKAIVFSQWTSMLDLIETSLNLSHIQYRRLDGSMTLPSRDRAVKDFNSNPEVTVMLMSLKAGNLGLNMIAACHVILLDPWWNPTTEDQAIDRAHRIGQTRSVIVSRLTVNDTVEDRILALQEKKREMVSAAFGEDQALGSGGATRLNAEDLLYLFNV